MGTLLKLVVWLGVLSGSQGCQTANTSKGNAVSTDFSTLRPSYEGLSVQEDPEQKRFADAQKSEEAFEHPMEISAADLGDLIQEMAKYNARIKFTSGYRIQLYAGNDRNRVNEIKSQIYKLYPSVNLYPIYKQPTWRLKMGDYRDRYAAEVDLAKIKPVVKSALLIEDKIKLQTN